VRIANIDCFHDAPLGFSPLDLFPQTKSVIAFAIKTPKTTLKLANRITYTVIENILLEQTNQIALQLMYFFEENGYDAMIVPSEPYEYWDAKTKTGKGMVSLKHLAYKAGLGVFGKNHLLYNPNFGNLIRLGAVLTNAILDPDPIIKDSYCSPTCNLCIDNCPAGAISEKGVIQKKCREHSTRKTLKGDVVYDCNVCRKVCVNASGVKKSMAMSGNIL
jgi:epoxyqueuosine reductase